MEAKDFLLVATSAILMYGLSAAGRRYRSTLAAKPTSWLIAFQRKTFVIAWSLYGLMFCIVALSIGRLLAAHSKYLLTLAGIGISGASAYTLRELSGYAKSEIETRKKSNHPLQPTPLARRG